MKASTFDFYTIICIKLSSTKTVEKVQTKFHGMKVTIIILPEVFGTIEMKENNCMWDNENVKTDQIQIQKKKKMKIKSLHWIELLSGITMR